MANFAALRSQIELALAGRVTAPFAFRDRHAAEVVSTGIAELDARIGGLPRGGLTEIFGACCAGRTSLLFSALGARTAHGEACALIDGCDAFDPSSAQAAGVDLKQLLWVRCRNTEQSLRVADLLLQGGGFGFVALDLSDIPREVVRRVPLDTWFRFRRAVEDTATVLLVVGQDSHAKTCASLVLRLEMGSPRWSATLPPDAHAVPANLFRHPFSKLLEGFAIRAGVMHSRRHHAQRVAGEDRFDAGQPAIFKTHELWSYARPRENQKFPGPEESGFHSQRRVSIRPFTQKVG